MNILIASLRRPTDPQTFFSTLSHMAKSDDVVVHGMVLAAGPGCANIALRVSGPPEACEKLANGVTMALQPAKWSLTGDEIPDGVTVRGEI